MQYSLTLKLYKPQLAGQMFATSDEYSLTLKLYKPQPEAVPVVDVMNIASL